MKSRAVSLILPLLAALTMTIVLTGPPALAGPNDGGVLVVHASQLAYSADGVYEGQSGIACGQDGPPGAPACPPYDPVDGAIPCRNTAANPTLADLPGVPMVWYVMASFPETGCPRLKAVSFRFDYDEAKMTLVAWGTPAYFQVTLSSDLPGGAAFPAPGSGVGESFQDTGTSLLKELYWFAGYAYAGESDVTFALRAKDSEDDFFVDDDVPGNVDQIRAFGTLGLGGTSGSNPAPGGPPILGACCGSSGNCSLWPENDCLAYGGDFMGVGVPCEPNPCPPPTTGACCDHEGHCHLYSLYQCGLVGWDYQGDNTPCTPNPCPQPVTGACCFADGSCLLRTGAQCLLLGGSYRGAGSTCVPNPCPQPPTGACCRPNGSCHVRTTAACSAEGGIYQGDGTSCTPNPCPQPVSGACCYPSGGCRVQEAAACLAAGGVFQGGDTGCEPNPCPQPPPPPGGGETMADAILIPSLPFAEAGSTAAYADNYDEVCPYSGSTARDIVYRYAPVADESINVNLCASTYDTKVYVYQDAAGNLVGCNDDYSCGYSGYQSKLVHLDLVAGHDYYIVVDGYGSSDGGYELVVTVNSGCEVECPVGALVEGEPRAGTATSTSTTADAMGRDGSRSCHRTGPPTPRCAGGAAPTSTTASATATPTGMRRSRSVAR